MKHIILLTGYGGTGKDEAADYLVDAHGFQKYAVGDASKRHFWGSDQSKWPTHGHEKDLWRPKLEQYTHTHLESIVHYILSTAILTCCQRLVCPRVNSAEEVELWKGMLADVFPDAVVDVYWMSRPGTSPATEHESKMWSDMRHTLSDTLMNDGDIDDLHCILDSLMLSQRDAGDGQ